jgi:hypothetical protein
LTLKNDDRDENYCSYEKKDFALKVPEIKNDYFILEAFCKPKVNGVYVFMDF